MLGTALQAELTRKQQLCCSRFLLEPRDMLELGIKVDTHINTQLYT